MNLNNLENEGGTFKKNEIAKAWSQFVFAHDNYRKKNLTIPKNRWGDASILSIKSPWAEYEPSDSDTGLPHMLTSEEISYLSWISKELATENDVIVEIGPWLGKSTRLLTYGEGFRRKVTTVDDFVWRDTWMNNYVDPKLRLSNHETFEKLFRELNSDYADFFSILRRRLNVYDGNEKVEPLISDDLPNVIDLLFVDCGRTIEVNETWWQIMQPKLVSGESLIVMQDWKLWRECPQKWYNQTLMFSESHSDRLHLIHEVIDGGLAAFLYV
jgi:hypothetical protein